MEQTLKEMLKAYVDSQKFNSTTNDHGGDERDVSGRIQQVMESELDYEPQIIGKYSRNAEGMEEKILGLYAGKYSNFTPASCKSLIL